LIFVNISTRSPPKETDFLHTHHQHQNRTTISANEGNPVYDAQLPRNMSEKNSDKCQLHFHTALGNDRHGVISAGSTGVADRTSNNDSSSIPHTADKSPRPTTPTATATDATSPGYTNHVSYWAPNGVQYLATSGLFFVGTLEDGRTVLKYPHRKTPETMSCLREEADRYERLGPHENLVTYRGFNEDGLLLEYCERGALGDLIQYEEPSVLTDSHKCAIGTQIVRCLAFMHRRNYIHCDVHVRNILLTSELVAKVGDLQGQLYRADGSIEWETMSEESPKSRHPDADEDEFTPRTDIFALGTLLYHLWHGHEPFPELDRNKHLDLIGARFRGREYPADLNRESGIGVIICKCWDSEYERADEILEDMCKFGAEEVS
jgi:hypothetical protein